ncbi:putative steryl acetyl hydrolase [Lyophyllum shimeji]|uniref:Steryl acetyl hydrolase n=1 Tax=Lyophyllum shimeji TaxID=47721 RepID=A0A9P3UNL6_LYOSH|nr:putative steryl acetyl hydrolase [Lyophyllum shimeji]
MAPTANATPSGVTVHMSLHHVRPYPHHAHLPYSREPLKSLYVSQRILTTLALVPWWVLCYAIVPRSHRPRASWSLRQIVNVNFTRRIFKITEVAGVTYGTRDPEEAPAEGELRETRFEWVEPLPEHLRTGVVVVNGVVPFKRVGCYVWPKEPPPEVESIMQGLEEGHSPVIGIFMHGGGYCHMSAHETSRTSRIPRRLIRDKMMSEVYSVEYRLLQHAPFPAVIQDAAAVYAHVVDRFRKTHKPGCKIVLIGDSSGGNLVLALARWLRDEGKLPMPDGLLLLSPSCDVSHALPETLSSYIPRPNAATDYLVDTPEPRALLQRTFLGFPSHGPTTPEEQHRLLQLVHSEYVSPCSPRVLQAWSHAVEQDAHGEHREAFQEYVSTTEEEHVNHAYSYPGQWTSEYRARSTFKKLFEAFPRTLIVVGDAERLVREVLSLQQAMERDGVDVRTEWVKDAVHDILIMAEGWWDTKACEQTWGVIRDWVDGFHATAA